MYRYRVPVRDQRCPDPCPHGPHEWFDSPPAFRLDCPGVVHHLEWDGLPAPRTPVQPGHEPGS